MAQQIKKKFIGSDEVDGSKILLEDGQAIRALDGVTEVELIKVSGSEVFVNELLLLDSSGKVDSARLPSYVDDVLEYADFASLPGSGETGKIYVTLDTNKTYRWSGSAYVQITSGAVDSVNGDTGIVVLDSTDINLSNPVNGQTTVQTSLEDHESRLDTLELGGGDTKQVKISANDTTEGYIEDKIVGASGKISISTLNDAGDEDLQISIGADVFDKTVDNTDNITEGVTNLFFTDARAKSAAVADAINDGTTDVAPSQNAVFDALALKANSNLDNLIASSDSAIGYKLYSNLTFVKGVGTNITLRGKEYIAGEASGSMSIFSGSTTDSNSGGVFINSGNVLAGATTGNSGAMSVKSGNISDGSGTSGAAQLLSGNTISGTSGYAALGSGNSSAGASGDVYIYTGLASTTRGKIELDASQVELLNTKIIFTGSQQKIENMADPTAAQDAATKAYVDSVAEGLKPKQAVRAASTANIDLVTGGLLTIDGVVLSAGDRVLVKDQTSAAENGIYIAASGAWARSSDFDNIPGDEVNGAYTFVQEGTANAGKGYVQTGTVTTIGTDPMNFVYFNSVANLIGGNGIAINSNIIEVNYAANSGLKFVSNELAVEPNDFAGNGLEDDGSDNLQIKLEFATTPDLAVSASGLSVANRWGKESMTLSAGDITNGWVDLAVEIEENSLVAFVDRLGIHEGDDYTITYQGGVGGVSRVTFAGELISPGQSQLAANDNLYFTYQKKAN